MDVVRERLTTIDEQAGGPPPPSPSDGSRIAARSDEAPGTEARGTIAAALRMYGSAHTLITEGLENVRQHPLGTQSPAQAPPATTAPPANAPGHQLDPLGGGTCPLCRAAIGGFNVNCEPLPKHSEEAATASSGSTTTLQAGTSATPSSAARGVPTVPSNGRSTTPTSSRARLAPSRLLRGVRFSVGVPADQESFVREVTDAREELAEAQAEGGEPPAAKRIKREETIEKGKHSEADEPKAAESGASPSLGTAGRKRRRSVETDGTVEAEQPVLGVDDETRDDAHGVAQIGIMRTSAILSDASALLESADIPTRRDGQALSLATPTRQTTSATAAFTSQGQSGPQTSISPASLWRSPGTSGRPFRMLPRRARAVPPARTAGDTAVAAESAMGSAMWSFLGSAPTAEGSSSNVIVTSHADDDAVEAELAVAGSGELDSLAGAQTAHVPTHDFAPSVGARLSLPLPLIETIGLTGSVLMPRASEEGLDLVAGSSSSPTSSSSTQLDASTSRLDADVSHATSTTTAVAMDNSRGSTSSSSSSSSSVIGAGSGGAERALKRRRQATEEGGGDDEQLVDFASV